ncbi:hypothetical protein ACHAW6_009085 [Cyclotella cf. meneghiniana]
MYFVCQALIGALKPKQTGSLTLSTEPLVKEASSHKAPFSAELARWHFRLGHLAYDKLKKLSKRGEIPKKLKDLIPSMCTGCLFGTMTKVLWCTTSEHQSKVFAATYPGQCTSVDQFQSSQADFLTKLKGNFTT